MLSSPAGVIRRSAAGVAIVLAATTAGACSSSGGSGGDPSASSSSAVTPSTSAASSSAAPATSSSVSAPKLTAADTKEIKNAYVTFFDSKTKVAKSEAVLQHGSVFRATLKTQAASPTAQGLSATVSKVQSQQPNVALVTFTLLSAGKAVLPDTPGYAVKEGGKWKVAAGSFCGLLKLQNSAPKECDDSTITAFPAG
jgi:hypothetical protein